ncbi:MAG: hypothetical protein Q8N17_18450 [Burkholderiaceae bacterium]|nr:hypothetical protein [Burkholderiaceae bacterium]
MGGSAGPCWVFIGSVLGDAPESSPVERLRADLGAVDAIFSELTAALK